MHLRTRRRSCPSRRMAQEEGGSLSEMRARVGASHRITDLVQKLHFYDRWAPDYDQVNPLGALRLPCSPSISFPVSTAGISLPPRVACENAVRETWAQPCSPVPSPTGPSAAALPSDQPHAPQWQPLEIKGQDLPPHFGPAAQAERLPA